MEKLPPLEKVYEAWSALADRRVSVCAGERRATVMSSNGQKEYTVAWDPDECVYSSNDNATYWQGYAGYPVLAVLMEQGRLPFDRAAAKTLAGVNWTELNERFKRDYTAVVAHIVDERDLDATQLDASARAVLNALTTLDLTIKRSSTRPPKTGSV